MYACSLLGAALAAVFVCRGAEDAMALIKLPFLDVLLWRNVNKRHGKREVSQSGQELMAGGDFRLSARRCQPAEFVNLCFDLSVGNHHEDSVHAREEAVEICERLLGRNLLVELSLASAPRSLAASLHAMGRHEDAAPSYEKGAMIYSKLAETDPKDTAYSLHELAVDFRSIGLHDDAIRAEADAVELYRKLVQAKPGLAMPLVMCLEFLAEDLRTLEREEKVARTDAEVATLKAAPSGQAPSSGQAPDPVESQRWLTDTPVIKNTVDGGNNGEKATVPLALSGGTEILRPIVRRQSCTARLRRASRALKLVEGHAKNPHMQSWRTRDTFCQCDLSLAGEAEQTRAGGAHGLGGEAQWRVDLRGCRLGTWSIRQAVHLAGVRSPSAILNRGPSFSFWIWRLEAPISGSSLGTGLGGPVRLVFSDEELYVPLSKLCRLSLKIPGSYKYAAPPPSGSHALEIRRLPSESEAIGLEGKEIVSDQRLISIRTCFRSAINPCPQAIDEFKRNDRFAPTGPLPGLRQIPMSVFPGKTRRQRRLTIEAASVPQGHSARTCSTTLGAEAALPSPFPILPSPPNGRPLLFEHSSDESTLPRSTPSSPRRTLSNAYSRAVHCARSLATSSSRRRRAPRVFPSLPPPAEWAEVPLTVESDSESESESESDAFSSGLILGAHATRKVRFIVAPVLARVTRVDYDDEEPAWCDFMTRSRDARVNHGPLYQSSTYDTRMMPNVIFFPTLILLRAPAQGATAIHPYVREDLGRMVQMTTNFPKQSSDEFFVGLCFYQGSGHEKTGSPEVWNPDAGLEPCLLPIRIVPSRFEEFEILPASVFSGLQLRLELRAERIKWRCSHASASTIGELATNLRRPIDAQ
ncbi:hypothetical protein DFH09DRAFT_1297338 [Mycena vulgaris]|nr:hypothetical protein DFH09DRAFT_1297338 [Mycena vulgaris]